MRGMYLTHSHFPETQNMTTRFTETFNTSDNLSVWILTNGLTWQELVAAVQWLHKMVNQLNQSISNFYGDLSSCYHC